MWTIVQKYNNNNKNNKITLCPVKNLNRTARTNNFMTSEISFAALHYIAAVLHVERATVHAESLSGDLNDMFLIIV